MQQPGSRDVHVASPRTNETTWKHPFYDYFVGSLMGWKQKRQLVIFGSLNRPSFCSLYMLVVMRFTIFLIVRFIIIQKDFSPFFFNSGWLSGESKQQKSFTNLSQSFRMMTALWIEISPKSHTNESFGDDSYTIPGNIYNIDTQNSCSQYFSGDTSSKAPFSDVHSLYGFFDDTNPDDTRFLLRPKAQLLNHCRRSTFACHVLADFSKQPKTVVWERWWRIVFESLARCW